MKEKEATQDKAESPWLEMTDLGIKNCQQALKTGLKLQEEAGRFWSGLCTQSTSAPDYQKRFAQLNEVVSGLVTSTQKCSQEVLELLEHNGRTNVELAKKAFDAARTPVIAESEAKWLDFYKVSLDKARHNVETVTQITSRAFDACLDVMRKNTETRVPAS